MARQLSIHEFWSQWSEILPDALPGANHLRKKRWNLETSSEVVEFPPP